MTPRNLLAAGLFCGLVVACANPQAELAAHGHYETTGGSMKLALIPPAEQDDDGRYLNLDPEGSHGSIATRLGFFGRRILTPFRAGAGAAEHTTEAQVSIEAADSVQWVGHSTLLVSMHGLHFLTDPIWSNTPSPTPPFGPSRFVPPGLALQDLPYIDFILVSHNHYDHLDVPTLKKLAKQFPDTPFIVPKDNAALLNKHGVNNTIELNWGEQTQIGNLTISCLPSQHWSKRGIGDTRQALWSSWSVTSPNKRFYFGGDSAYFSGYKLIGDALGPFDLVALPIGAYSPRDMMQGSHMNPEEAIKAALDLRATRVLPIHYGTFDLSDEPLDEPLARFETALQTMTNNLSALILKIGERHAF